MHPGSNIIRVQHKNRTSEASQKLFYSQFGAKINI